MGHRIPKACKNNAVVLARIIEIDETYVDGKEKTKKVQGRSTKTKTPVVSMRDRSVELVATKMGNVNGANIQSMIDNHVNDNARLCTDEATIYKRIKGYKQLMVNHSAGQYVNGIVHTNGIESV